MFLPIEQKWKLLFITPIWNKEYTIPSLELEYNPIILLAMSVNNIPSAFFFCIIPGFQVRPEESTEHDARE